MAAFSDVDGGCYGSLGGLGGDSWLHGLGIGQYTTNTTTASSIGSTVMTTQMIVDAIQQVRARERANDLRAAVLAGHYSAQQFARDKATNTSRKKLLLCAV